jgi:hypothetical protein
MKEMTSLIVVMRLFANPSVAMIDGAGEPHRPGENFSDAALHLTRSKYHASFGRFGKPKITHRNSNSRPGGGVKMQYGRWAVAGLLLLMWLAVPTVSAMAGTVAYFYNQTDSAAPIGITIKGKTTVTVKPVAPGHISAAITLPNGYLAPMYASAAMQKSLKDMGLPLPALIDISFRSPGGSTKLGLPLHADILDAGHVSALIYFMRVKVPGAAPEPEDMTAVTVQDSDYKLAAEGKALVAVVDETHAKWFQLESSPLFNVWFRKPDGSVWNEDQSSSVSPALMTAGHYDILAASTSMTLRKARTAKPIGSLTPANLKPGRISVYLIRKPGKLEHVITLSPQ